MTAIAIAAVTTTIVIVEAATVAATAEARAAVRAHKSVAPRSPRGTRRVRAVAAATSVTESVVAAASVATAASASAAAAARRPRSAAPRSPAGTSRAAAAAARRRRHQTSRVSEAARADGHKRNTVGSFEVGDAKTRQRDTDLPDLPAGGSERYVRMSLTRWFWDCNVLADTIEQSALVPRKCMRHYSPSKWTGVLLNESLHA
mmetsp:Transcript_17351/g.37300  ORF Transcript_17351/g.37300 Transcript_17351/m.37300 type:complete len:203 (+) Transcript_17351:683-1291(+)